METTKELIEKKANEYSQTILEPVLNIVGIQYAINPEKKLLEQQAHVNGLAFSLDMKIQSSRYRGNDLVDLLVNKSVVVLKAAEIMYDLQAFDKKEEEKVPAEKIN